MKAQDIFDRALRGVIEQGGPSYKGGKCWYRGGKGRKCAFGHLIPDTEYDPKMEGVSAVEVICRWKLPFKGHEGLILDIQHAHDNAAMFDTSFMDDFKLRMRLVAERYNLEVKI